MPTAAARHILVSTEEECQALKDQIEGGADFADLAKKHSSCPSGKEGGDLGEFGPGQMVPEFDSVVFTRFFVTGLILATAVYCIALTVFEFWSKG